MTFSRKELKLLIIKGIELVRYKSKLPFDYYKEIILNYRKLLPRLDMQKIQDYALMAPKSNKVLEILQMEVL